MGMSEIICTFASESDFPKTDNFLAIRKRKVIQNGKPHSSEKA